MTSVTGMVFCQAAHLAENKTSAPSYQFVKLAAKAHCFRGSGWAGCCAGRQEGSAQCAGRQAKAGPFKVRNCLDRQSWMETNTLQVCMFLNKCSAKETAAWSERVRDCPSPKQTLEPPTWTPGSKPWRPCRPQAGHALWHPPQPGVAEARVARTWGGSAAEGSSPFLPPGFAHVGGPVMVVFPSPGGLLQTSGSRSSTLCGVYRKPVTDSSVGCQTISDGEDGALPCDPGFWARCSNWLGLCSCVPGWGVLCVVGRECTAVWVAKGWTVAETTTLHPIPSFLSPKESSPWVLARVWLPQMKTFPSPPWTRCGQVTESWSANVKVDFWVDTGMEASHCAARVGRSLDPHTGRPWEPGSAHFYKREK